MNDAWTVIMAAEKDDKLVLVLEQEDQNGNRHLAMATVDDQAVLDQIDAVCSRLL